MSLLDLPGGREEEGVYISPYIADLCSWLDLCLDHIENGRGDEIPSDPFFESGLSDEQVDELIRAIDEDCAKEIGSFPGYHRNRSGAELPPEFARLSARGRRALAEGCLIIIRQHEAALA